MRHRSSRARLLAFVSLAALGLNTASAETKVPDMAAVLTTYSDIALAGYGDALASAQALDKAVDALIATPTDATLKAAQDAWRASRPSYQQTEAFRFGNAIVDDWEGRVNAWPLDEGLIDYVAPAYGTESDSNPLYVADIIAHPKVEIAGAAVDFTTITPALLQDKLQEAGGVEANVATGYHAIEFLLWGQDLSETGPGNRPYTDFLDNGTTPNGARRRQYLTLVTNLLVEDLESVQAAWAPGQDNYRKSFAAEAPKEAVLKMLTGLGSLSGAELAGERMTVAYDNKDQEDEHSCFSDNTSADLYNNALGIQNVYLGRYGTTDGAGLDELVAAVDPKLDEKMKQRLQASLDAIKAISGPFDQAILGENSSPGRQKVRAAITALRAQTETLVEVSTALGIQLNLE